MKPAYKYQAKFTDDDRDTILWALNLKLFELRRDAERHKEQLAKIEHAMSRLVMPESIKD